jgi:GNAT superfamily N-acetyltransferase
MRQEVISMRTLTKSSHATPPLDGAPKITVEVRAATSESDWQHARTLLRDYLDWLQVAGGIDALQLQPSLRQELTDLPAWYGRPRGVMLLAHLDGVAVGSVGVRAEPDGTAEMKRLYVQAAGRGHGLGARLVQAAHTAARDLGAETLRLVTVPGLMDPAIALYRQLGFVPTAQFGEMIADSLLYLEQPLAQAETRAA